MVARFGGDEFAVLLCDLSAEASLAAAGRAGASPRGADARKPAVEPCRPEAVADQVAARIRLALREPYQIAGLAVTVGASVGTAVAPPAGGDVDALLHAADVAMYRVKADRRAPGPKVDVSSPVIHLDHRSEPGGFTSCARCADPPLQAQASMSPAGVGGPAGPGGPR